MTPALNPLPTVAILAGGLATRLRPMTETVPKSLLEVNGEPFAVHQLRLLQSKGIRRVVFCVGHLGELIQQTIGNGSTLGLQVDYSFDGPALLGTAGAVRNALPKLGDSFFVMYGDSYLPSDYAAIARHFQTAGVLGMMTVFRNEGKWDTSNVEFEAGGVKESSGVQQDEPYAAACAISTTDSESFAPKHFKVCLLGKACDLAKLYADLLQRKQLAAFEVRERFYEIGSPSGLQETAEFLAAQGVSRAT